MAWKFNPFTKKLDIDKDSGSGAMSDLVDDTTPQLGGDLDLNGKNIDFPTTANISDVLDEDNMASNSATALATQQSIKAYVDSNSGGTVDTSGTPVANDYARFTDLDTIEGRSYAEVKADLSLEDADINTLITATKLDDLATPDDNTDLNVSATYHGLTPKHPNDSDQVLLGDGTWGTVAAGSVDSIVLACRNTSGSTITKGSPVYESGWNGGTNRIEISLADANGTGTMPAVGLVQADIANNSNGQVIVYGALEAINTSAYSAGDALYVSETAGQLTATKPTAATSEVQKVGTVLNAAVSGAILVSGANRTNDIPNTQTDTRFRIVDDGDTTKIIAFQASGITTGTTRTITMPDEDVTLNQAASTTVSGIAELATAAETTTGTDTGRVVTPDGLAGSEFGERAVQLVVFDYTTDTATGDGKAYFHIDSRLAGMNLVDVHAEVITAGTTGTTDIQIHNLTQVADMLSTKLTIDSGETGSDTAATAAVIDTANDDVAENDLLRIDIDAISTTAAKGLILTMGFRLP